MGLPSMSVTEVKGSGRQKGFTESYRGAKTTIFLRPKLKLEMVLDDGDLDRAIDSILELAHTGEPGDGKIFIFAVEEASGSVPGSAGTSCSPPTRRRPPPSGTSPRTRYGRTRGAGGPWGRRRRRVQGPAGGTTNTSGPPEGRDEVRQGGVDAEEPGHADQPVGER